VFVSLCRVHRADMGVDDLQESVRARVRWLWISCALYLYTIV